MPKEDGKINSDYYRIVTTRRPSINLYEDIISDDKFDILNQIEALTSSRQREDRGETYSISGDEQYAGVSNKSLVDAPFTYKSKSRFSNGSFGIFYAGKELQTAIEETVYHKAKFFKSTNEAGGETQQRVLTGKLSGTFKDIRNQELPDIYSPDDYSAAQVFGFKVKELSSDGILYDSVRHSEGECFAVFKPCVIKSCKEIKTLNYIWDGNKITVKDF